MKHLSVAVHQLCTIIANSKFAEDNDPIGQFLDDVESLADVSVTKTAVLCSDHFILSVSRLVSDAKKQYAKFAFKIAFPGGEKTTVQAIHAVKVYRKAVDLMIEMDASFGGCLFKYDFKPQL